MFPQLSLPAFLLLIVLVICPPTQAQWSVVDANNKPSPVVNGEYALTGPMTGSADNTYPQDMTGYCVSHQGAAVLSCYSPNPLSTYGWLYPNSPVPAPTALQPQVGLSASAANDFYWSNLSYGYWRVPGSDWTQASSIEPLKGSSTTDVGGVLSAWFVYSPPSYPSASPAPSYINVLLTTMLTASAGTSYGTSGLSSGLSATATASDSLNEQAEADAPALGSPPPTRVVGHHLLRVPVTGGRAQVTLGGKVKLNATDGIAWGQPYFDWESGYYQDDVQTNGNTSASSSGFVSATVRQDSREVAISCPTIETPNSYYKGPVDSQHTTGQWPHIRDVDGSMSTDSSLDWNTSSQSWANSNLSASNGVPFTATASNFTNPNYTWKLTGNGVPDNESQNYLSSDVATVPLHLLFSPSADALPGSNRLRVDVQGTDSQGNNPATAVNTYDVTWHFPYEITAFLGSVPKKTQLNKVYGPIHQGDMADVQTSQARDIDIGEGFDAAGAVAGIGGQEEAAAVLEIIGKIAKISDFKYHYGGESTQYGTQNGQDKWTATLNNSKWAANVDDQNLLNYQDPRTGAFDGWVFCDLSIYEVKLYHHKTWDADRYTVNGYDSTGYVLYADPIDGIEEEPYYTEVSTPPAAPGP